MNCKHPHIFRLQTKDPYRCLACGRVVMVSTYESETPEIEKGQAVSFKGFGEIDKLTFKVTDISEGTARLELQSE